jgi:hypothetical protein
MRNIKRKEPFLNSLARKLGHVAGSVAKVTQDFAANSSTETPPVSSDKPGKRGKRAAQKKQTKKTSAQSRRGSVKSRKPKLKSGKPKIKIK